MNEVLEEKVKQLPTEARREVADYVDFLLYKYHVRKTVRPRVGCMQGTFTWMSEDFNAPLEDFNDYQ
jgi:hypothetical protein